MAGVAEIDDDALATWRSFLNAHARVTRAIGRDLAAAGLPDLSWYAVLWARHRAPGRGLRVNELARAIVLSPTGMSRFADRMEAEGLVRREPDPADRRALQVVLTDGGRDLLRRMWPVYARGIETHFAAHLPGSSPRLRATFDAMATMESSASPSASPSSSPS